MKFKKPTIVDRRHKALGSGISGAYPFRLPTYILQIVWHYTATLKTKKDDNALIDHEHYWNNTLGWDKGGYTYYINREGTIYWNYDLREITYGAGRLNPQLLHICCEADSSTSYTQAQIKARRELTLWLMDYLKIEADNVVGHCEVPYNSTNCPGYEEDELNNFRKELKALYNGSGNLVVPNDSKMSTGKYRITIDKLSIRNYADLSKHHESGLYYTKNQEVNIERILEGATYIWGSYISYTGVPRFIILKEIKSGKMNVKKV